MLYIWYIIVQYHEVALSSIFIPLFDMIKQEKMELKFQRV